MSFFDRPDGYDSKLHRRVGIGLIVWAAAFFGLMIVPLLLNGWNRPALFADALWRASFGGYLLASGMAAIAFCRALAEFHTRRDEQAWPERVMRRILPWDRSYVMNFSGHMVSHILFGSFMAAIGFSICIDRFPHPKW